MKVYRHAVTVEGNFRFPIDMLRYDRCSPASETDSGLINRTFTPYEDVEKAKIVVVCDAPKNWKPTIDRWRSFGWKVISHDIQPF